MATRVRLELGHSELGMMGGRSRSSPRRSALAPLSRARRRSSVRRRPSSLASSPFLTCGAPPSPHAWCGPVFMHYTGKLTNGEKFDSSLDRGTPFDFVLGAGNVIKARLVLPLQNDTFYLHSSFKGWDLGIVGMCPGEKRKLKARVRVTRRSAERLAPRVASPHASEAADSRRPGLRRAWFPAEDPGRRGPGLRRRDVVYWQAAGEGGPVERRSDAGGGAGKRRSLVVGVAWWGC